MHPTTITAIPAYFATHSWLRNIACVALCLMVAACGFRIKGPSPLPFNTLYTNIAENSAFGAGMRRAIIASSPNTQFVPEPEQAQARLIQLSNQRNMRELSIDAQGQVEEYELSLAFTFQLTDAQGHIILPPTTLRATREVPYDPNVVQAKQGEIATVFKEMQQSMVNRVVRLLSAPDVAEAFRDAENQPIDETPSDLTPLPADTTTPTPWGASSIVPDSRF